MAASVVRRSPARPARTTTTGPKVMRVTAEQARRFALRQVGLETPFASVGEALRHLGYVQIDPINVCGRMHDLILRNRVTGYTEGDLVRFLHPEPTAARTREAFEHHLTDNPILVALPVDAWPHLLRSMEERTTEVSEWSGRLQPREQAMAVDLLAEIKRRGPLSSQDVEDDGGAAPGGWGGATLAKSTLQKLFFHGRLLIAARDGNRRLYDLPERVLPPATLSARAPTREETQRWATLTKLRQRRLTVLKRTEWLGVAELVQPVEVTDADLPLLYCLNDDVGAWECLVASAPGRPRLLAPLDPLIYERRVTEGLWGFDYTWEVYTPAARRRRGYYALPLLDGEALVGHLDPKVDRKRGRLQVLSRSAPRGCPWSQAKQDLAAFLGVR